jgi:hypothetical protein
MSEVLRGVVRTNKGEPYVEEAMNSWWLCPDNRYSLFACGSELHQEDKTARNENGECDQ